MLRQLTIVLAGLGLSVALAQDQPLPSFDEVDANRDGVIAADEATAVEGLDFRIADANRDGVIDRAEYRALG